LLPACLLGGILLEVLVLGVGRGNLVEGLLVKFHEHEELGETFQFLGYVWTCGSKRGILASVRVC
jgi:hypothetical protein